jgi:hypothetical protein
MAVRTSSLSDTNSTDASFRAWINEIHNSLIAFGWVQTSDTGQINFSTVTRPTAVNLYQGFAVYKMGDANQATCAVFMRLDFGTAGSTDLPGIKIKFGIGSTDGAGTLTGNLSTQITTGSSSMSAQGAGNCRTSGDSSSFRMHFFSTSLSSAGWTLAVERDKDTSGNDTTLGVNIAFQHCVTGGITVNSQFLENAGGTGALESRWYAMVSAQASNSGNGTTGVGPVRCALGPLRNPMKGLLVYARPDFAPETTNPISIYGATHTYLMLRPDLGGARTLNTWQTDCGLALLWE